jgi:hypothetical protein
MVANDPSGAPPIYKVAALVMLIEERFCNVGCLKLTRLTPVAVVIFVEPVMDRMILSIRKQFQTAEADETTAAESGMYNLDALGAARDPSARLPLNRDCPAATKIA